MSIQVLLVPCSPASVCHPRVSGSPDAAASAPAVLTAERKPRWHSRGSSLPGLGRGRKQTLLPASALSASLPPPPVEPGAVGSGDFAGSSPRESSRGWSCGQLDGGPPAIVKGHFGGDKIGRDI